MNMQYKNSTWAFFGTSSFSVLILDALKEKGFIPSLIVTVPDKPKGRKLILTPPEAKVWAQKENIPCIQPPTLKNEEVVEHMRGQGEFDFFVVASYGKIIPQAILDIPKLGTLNVHPSLLPKLRGASPIESAILKENETGVTIIRLDAEMDHGPIVAQEKVEIRDWPPYAEDLEKTLGLAGGRLLGEMLPDWIDGKVEEIAQDHEKATLCGKIQKTDGELNLADNVETNLRKIRAYHVWPGAYFFHKNKRVIVKRAHIENDLLILDRVVPEGRNEMSYTDFLNGIKN